MTAFTWIWLVMLVAFVGVEGTALAVQDTPGQPRTLTANVRRLITGASWWHWLARMALAALLVWLPIHFGL